MTPDLVFNFIGVAGFCSILLAYFLLQHGTVKGNDYKYLSLNLTGAVLLAVSLLWSWNLASFMLECAWIAISLYGLLRRWQTDRKAAPGKIAP